MSYARIEHSGGAVNTTLQSDIASGVTSLTLVASTNWPTGGTGPFYLVIDPGQSTEEKILATARSSNTLTGLTRGADGTSASAHSAGAVISHIYSAAEADEANVLVKATLGSITAKGDSPVATASQTLGVLPVGANNTVQIADSSAATGQKWAFVTSASLATNSVTATQITDGTITPAELASDSVTTVKILDANVTTAKIADANVTLAKFGTGLRPVTVCTSGTRPGSPNVGDLIYETDTFKTLQYQGATTSWTPLWSDSWGYDGREVTSTSLAQAGVSAEVDVTGFTNTYTYVANRRIRANWHATIALSNASDRFQIKLTDGSNTQVGTAVFVPADTQSITVFGQTTFTPSAGSQTYKLRIARVNGSGTATISAAAGNPAQFTLEDIGPSANPA